VQRAIIGFHCDDTGDWVAELSCGHAQHVRHRPPFELRPWVIDDAQREGRLGSFLGCPLCDRAELPEGLRLVRSSREWDEHTLPAGLCRAHRLDYGTWGRVVVHEGRLCITMSAGSPIEVVLGPGGVQAIPPEVEHEVRPLGPVWFHVDFLGLMTPAHPMPGDDRGGELGCNEPVSSAMLRPVDSEGGEAACWLHLVCLECGAMLDGDPHRAGCSAATLG